LLERRLSWNYSKPLAPRLAALVFYLPRLVLSKLLVILSSDLFFIGFSRLLAVSKLLVSTFAGSSLTSWSFSYAKIGDDAPLSSYTWASFKVSNGKAAKVRINIQVKI